MATKKPTKSIKAPAYADVMAPAKKPAKKKAAPRKRNPVAIVAPGPDRKTHWDLPHLFPQTGGAYMISNWSGRGWRNAHLALSLDAAKKWLDYQGYKKAVLVK